MPLSSGIYVIENVTTGDFYIGAAKDLLSRRRQHFHELRRGTHPNPRMRRAFNRDGAGAFRWQVVAIVSKSEAFNTEERLLAKLVGRSDCYNICRQPTSGMGGRRHTAESRAKMSAAQRGKRHSPETRAKMSASRTGKKNPEGAAKRRGRKATAESKERRQATLGRMATENDPKFERIRSAQFKAGHAYLPRRNSA